MKSYESISSWSFCDQSTSKRIRKKSIHPQGRRLNPQERLPMKNNPNSNIKGGDIIKLICVIDMMGENNINYMYIMEYITTTTAIY